MPSPEREKTKILIVDDHPLVREWLANLINQQPDLAVSGEAENSQGAMRAVRDCPPHVAIVDISLSDSSGLELIKEIKQAHPEIRVLVLTMHEESHYAARALRAGAAAYLVEARGDRQSYSGDPCRACGQTGSKPIAGPDSTGGQLDSGVRRRLLADGSAQRPGVRGF